ncbi:MAG: class I tRNA ligase family protein [Actinobacteria bacterium]|nr:class I tRNA ligase family protein [Actinomycetota bacterium]MTA56846.1 class I tRNA ligase family protein [Actinomycetota bacterium]MTA99465.1 class I tRNA ligase family protein [Actinomycetota bacterium]
MKNWPKVYLPPINDLKFPPLKLHDSYSGLYEYSKSGKFRMYVCGITPYDSTHLGHAATYLSFDLINRYQQLANLQVSFVENVTDVDDPLLERAKRDGQDWQVLANSQVDLFISDMTALRILPPSQLVKVTDSLDLVESFIDKLDRNGHIYQIDGDFYFSVDKYLDYLPIPLAEAISVFAERGGDPDKEGKRHPLDAVVWSANKNGEPGWNSKYGFGRPGWHIECTAIACEFLDNDEKDPVIQLQGGGSDLIFPHHFMSAQIVKAALGRDFAESYIHAGMIGLDGEKMSKSKGNLIFVSKLIREGVDPMVIRWALLSGHYQQDREWSTQLLERAKDEVMLVRSALSRSETADASSLVNNLIKDLSDNLNTPKALSEIVDWSLESNKIATSNHSGLVSRAIDSLLGLAL